MPGQRDYPPYISLTTKMGSRTLFLTLLVAPHAFIEGKMSIDGIKISAFPALTQLAADDKIITVDTSTSTTKYINNDDLFGKTSGIAVPIGVRIAPSYTIHGKNTGSNCTVALERDAGATAVFYAAATTANFGSMGVFASRIIVNSLVKLTMGTDGSMTAPDVFGDTGNGTDIDLYCDNTGFFGAHPSASKYKENERPITKGHIDRVLNLTVKMFDYKNGGAINQTGFIAEEVAGVMPELVSNRTYKVVDGEREVLSRSEYVNIAEMEKQLSPGVPHRLILKKIIPAVKEDEVDTFVDEEVELISLPESINHSRLIPFLVAKIQEQEVRLNEVLEKISILEAKLI
jgi:hypothetical protein